MFIPVADLADLKGCDRALVPILDFAQDSLEIIRYRDLASPVSVIEMVPGVISSAILVVKDTGKGIS